MLGTPSRGPQLSPRKGVRSGSLQEAPAGALVEEQTSAGREGGRNVSDEGSKLDSVWPDYRAARPRGAGTDR